MATILPVSKQQISLIVKEVLTSLQHVTRPAPNFYTIKRVTNGMLRKDVYEEIYHQAMSAMEGNMLDIGVGRGPSSVSIGLAIKASKSNSRVFCIDRFYQNTTKHPHKYNMKTHPLNCIDLNCQVFSNNLKRFGVADKVTIVVGDTTDAGNKIPQTVDYSFMFLDVDGCVDRDFKVFYNLLIPGAVIIIDDYNPSIPRRIKNKYGTLTKEQKEDYLQDKDEYYVGRILGKGYLTYKLVEYFMEKGMLVKQKIVDSTFFGLKPLSIDQAIEFNDDDFKSIRATIRNEFLQLTS